MSEDRKTVRWLDFTSSGCAFYIGLDAQENKFVRYQLSEQVKGPELISQRRVLLAHGFQSTKDNAVWQKPIRPKAGFPIDIRRFQADLGGEWVDVDFQDFRKAPYVRRMDSDGLDRKTLKTIGQNHMGNSVYEAPDGTRYAESRTKDKLLEENKVQEPELWLRYTDKAQIHLFTGSLLRRIETSPVSKKELFDFVDVITSGYDGKLSKSEIAEQITAPLPTRIYHNYRNQITRQSLNDVTERRDAFRNAVNTAVNAQSILPAGPSSEDYNPTLLINIFLTNILQSISLDSYQVRGRGLQSVFQNSDRVGKAEKQLIDLSEATVNGDPSVVASSYLSDRLGEGRSVFFVPASADSDIVLRLRHALGKTYTFESVAEFSPELAYAAQSAEPLTLMIVGPRRPEPLNSIPEPALRTFNVSSGGDVAALASEIRRSSRRIRDHISAEQERIESQQNDVPRDEIRQMPYRAMSRATEPYTRVPSAFHGAINRAQTRVLNYLDGVDPDEYAANLLGMDVDDMKRRLLGEQIDAVLLWACARARRRGILIGDETGTGKGTTSAAITRAFLNGTNGKVIIMTKSAESNGPDVMRDLDRLGVPGTWPVRGVAASKKIVFESTNGTVSMLSSDERNNMFFGGEWPQDCKVLVAPYTLFRKDVEECAAFLENAIDHDTLLVFDESHLALNPNGKTGDMVRAMIDRVDRPNVTFLSATALRRPEGLDLYSRLLPEDASSRVVNSLQSLNNGGATILESLGTMLCEDGVYIRRTHDLSQLSVENVVMDGDGVARAAQIMNSVSPIFSDFVDIAMRVRAAAERRAGVEYRRALANGVPFEQALASSSEMNRYSMNFGGTLQTLGRNLDLAIKVDFIAQEAIDAYDAGLKPNIYVHSTGESILKDIKNAQKNNEPHTSPAQLTFRDQVIRQLDNIVKVRIGGEIVDARDHDETVAAACDAILERIAQIPDLPVSPIDAIIERLEEHGIRTGEITGRQLCLENGNIRQRNKDERNKRGVIDKYQSGEFDCVVYNSAADTGVTLSQTPESADQRRRCMIVGELPMEAIGYIQSIGRSNRFGQTEAPLIKVMVSGLAPTIRMTQFMNRMLKRLGATINGSRDHPLVSSDVPDLLNPIGDKAVMRVLQDDPSLALRLGFTDIHNILMTRNMDASERSVDDILSMNGDMNLTESTTNLLSNKLLTRLVILATAEEQKRVLDRVIAEFEAIEEELNDLGANPLKPKRLRGTIEPLETSLYSGLEGDANDSAFDKPLYLTVGIHHTPIVPFTEADVDERVAAAQMKSGVDGFAPYAEVVRQKTMATLSDLLPSEFDVQRALEAPHLQTTAFRSQMSRSKRLIEMLEKIKPGAIVDAAFFQIGTSQMVITGLQRPEPGTEHLASHYKVSCVRPGSDKEETFSLSRFFSLDRSEIGFPGNWLDETGSYMRRRFAKWSFRSSQEQTVQILSGNDIAALEEASRHKLGGMLEYVVVTGDGRQINRGIVSFESAFRLENLPLEVEKPFMAYELLKRAKADGENVKIWDSTEKSRLEADVAISLFRPSSNRPWRVRVDSFAISRGRHEYFAERPGLYEALTGHTLPSRSQMPIKRAPFSVTFEWENPDDHKKILTIINAHFSAPGVEWSTDGHQRARINEIRGLYAGTGLLTSTINVDAVMAERFGHPAVLPTPEVDPESVSVPQNLQHSRAIEAPETTHIEVEEPSPEIGVPEIDPEDINPALQAVPELRPVAPIDASVTYDPDEDFADDFDDFENSFGMDR